MGGTKGLDQQPDRDSDEEGNPVRGLTTMIHGKYSQKKNMKQIYEQDKSCITCAQMHTTKNLAEGIRTLKVYTAYCGVAKTDWGGEAGEGELHEEEHEPADAAVVWSSLSPEGLQHGHRKRWLGASALQRQGEDPAPVEPDGHEGDGQTASADQVSDPTLPRGCGEAADDGDSTDAQYVNVSGTSGKVRRRLREATVDICQEPPRMKPWETDVNRSEQKANIFHGHVCTQDDHHDGVS